ncbi:BPSL0761 family protein [Paraburkholderia caffeinilytica]|uniref:BPSL0761 family protein n=1 Tax=Paraburkholderia caffeinilytica TaxID=1761016 RepID=UPI0038B6DA4F
MTTPNQRTRAVLDARELLSTLAAGDEITIPGLVRSVAIALLRHYPLEIDISVSATMAPEVWAEPVRRPR